MRTDYYFPQSDVGSTTCTLFLAVSLIGAAVVKQQTSRLVYNSEILGNSDCLSVYYIQADQHSREAEVLRHFAKALLSDMKDNPQLVVDAMNRHFWDLL
jgi:hypothetical protein